MNDHSKQLLMFPSCKSKKVQADFTGGDVTSDAGVLLVRQVDKKIKLTSQIAQRLEDSREAQRCSHSLVSLIRQRVYGLTLGYEDLNDHDRLRTDPGFQTAVDTESALASAPTLCRLENAQDRKSAWAMHEVMVETFINSFKEAPQELILDFDATDDPVHGEQEGRFSHGYYDQYCFLPLYVFCGSQLLVAYLRPSKIDGAKHAWAILSLLVKRLRKAWPMVRIVFRADGGFCRWRMLMWCERANVGYIVGIARNVVLERQAQDQLERARVLHEQSHEKVRLFSDIYYAAATWDKSRRVLVKAEHTDKGSNPRFVVTNLSAPPQQLYDDCYCMRGDMENRIKEQQLALFSDRTSAHRWWANQFRVLLSGLAYVLLESLRRIALKTTPFAQAQCGTLRLKLLKIGALILRSTRRILFKLSSAYPYRELFMRVATLLSSA